MKLSEQCRKHDVTFEFIETGTGFVKKGKTYRIRDKRTQSLQAFKSELCYKEKETPCKSEIVKNAFLFACNCGLRLSDVLALKWSDITIDNDVWRVGTRMIKTERLVYVPLPLQARRWMLTDMFEAIIDILYCISC